MEHNLFIKKKDSIQGAQKIFSTKYLYAKHKHFKSDFTYIFTEDNKVV
jgi:hypothetical protein